MYPTSSNLDILNEEQMDIYNDYSFNDTLILEPNEDEKMDDKGNSVS